MYQNKTLLGLLLCLTLPLGCRSSGSPEGPEVGPRKELGVESPEGPEDGPAGRASGAESTGSKDERWCHVLPREGELGGSLVETEFGGEGLARIEGNALVLDSGVPLSGVTWLGELPRTPYVLEAEFTKRFGSDFPCALTFPVRDAHLTLVLGGWGGTVCGLSSLDGLDAARNDTRFIRDFPAGHRTRVRLEVDDTLVVLTLDGEEVLRTSLTGRELGLRPEMLPSRPLGVAAFATAVEFHTLRWTNRDTVSRP